MTTSSKYILNLGPHLAHEKVSDVCLSILGRPRAPASSPVENADLIEEKPAAHTSGAQGKKTRKTRNSPIEEVESLSALGSQDTPTPNPLYRALAMQTLLVFPQKPQDEGIPKSLDGERKGFSDQHSYKENILTRQPPPSAAILPELAIPKITLHSNTPDRNKTNPEAYIPPSAENSTIPALRSGPAYSDPASQTLAAPAVVAANGGIAIEIKEGTYSYSEKSPLPSQQMVPHRTSMEIKDLPLPPNPAARPAPLAEIKPSPQSAPLFAEEPALQENPPSNPLFKNPSVQNQVIVPSRVAEKPQTPITFVAAPTLRISLNSPEKTVFKSAISSPTQTAEPQKQLTSPESPVLFASANKPLEPNFQKYANQTEGSNRTDVLPRIKIQQPLSSPEYSKGDTARIPPFSLPPAAQSPQSTFATYGNPPPALIPAKGILPPIKMSPSPMPTFIAISQTVAAPILARLSENTQPSAPRAPIASPSQPEKIPVVDEPKAVEETAPPEPEVVAVMYETPVIIENYFGVGRI